MDVSSKDPLTLPLTLSELSLCLKLPPFHRDTDATFADKPLESGILMLYGNARRHRHIGEEAGIEEMETRKHSSSLLRIQAYARPTFVIIFRRPIALFELQFKPIQATLQFARN